MRWPNFIIIGAGKAGTTSLHYYLGQHPDVFMSSVKEPRFFCFEGEPASATGPGSDRWKARSVTSQEDYLELFAEATHERVLGEASTNYFHSDIALEAIRRRLPDVRLLAIFRDPIERALSAYGMARRMGIEPATTFDEALALEEERRNWWFGHYKGAGLYAAKLERYLNTFGRSQMALYVYDDLVADPLALCKSVFTFLEVDPAFSPDVSTARNAASTRLRSPSLRVAASLSRGIVPHLPRSVKRRFWNIGEQIGSRASREPEHAQISHRTRRELCEFYADDVKRLGGLLDRDLSHWLRAE